MMNYKEYTGHAEYDDDAKIFHGEVVGLSDTITFQGKNANELSQALQDSVDDYLRWCQEREENPTNKTQEQSELLLS